MPSNVYQEGNIMRYFILMWGVLFVTAPSIYAVPQQVILLRHAEKMIQEKRSYGEKYAGLSTKGFERAAALAVYLPAQFGLPDVVFATQPGYTYNAFRPIMTCAPLSYTLHQQESPKNDMEPIESFNLNYTDQEIGQLAKDLLNNPMYDGKNIVICWDHRKINAIAHALGVDEKKLKQWPETVFDVTYKITFDANKAQLKKVPQKLLYGDHDVVTF